MKRSLILIAIICIFSSVNSQTLDDSREFNIIPPSPDVASLLKFVEYPVSPFTGQPDINLPIYTIKEGSLSIPISIRHNGSGMKVNEESGVVGYGWSLDAGGSISRTIYGLPDDICPQNTSQPLGSPVGLFHLEPTTKNLRDSIFNRYIEYGYEIVSVHHGNVLGQGTCEYFNAGVRDVANDIFHLNCMGLSGTFAYDPNNDCRMILSSTSPITFSDTKAYGGNLPLEYNVYDDKGTLYKFGNIENIDTTITYLKENAQTQFVDSIKSKTAWHLNKIISITGDTIEFSYITGKKRFASSGITQYKYVKDIVSVGEKPQEGTSTSNTRYIPKLISQIKSRSVIVRFNYSNDTETLNSIEVIRNTPQQEVFQKYELKHYTINIASITKKLLSEIDRISMDGNSYIKLYQFNYMGGDNSSIRATMAIDHWGYYNGVSNKSLIQNSSILLTPGLGDRDPRENLTKCGVLDYIEYPTGGRTKFLWEQHDYSYIQTYQLEPYTSRDSTIRFEKFYGKNTSVNITMVNQLPDVVKEIVIGNEAWLNIDMTKYINESLAQNIGWDEYFNDHSHYEYTSPWLEEYPRFEIRDSANRLYQNYKWYIDSSECSGIKTAYLPPGNYKLILCNPTGLDGVTPSNINLAFGNSAENQGNGDEYGYIKVKITERSETLHNNYTKPWGGLRIAKITSTASDAQPITKEYYYKAGDINSNYSSGTIDEEPYYNSKSYEIKSEFEYINQSERIVEYVYVTTGYHSSGLYSSPNGGSHVEYPEVWEKYFDDSLMVRYEYDSQRYNPDIKRSSFYEYIPGGSRMKTSKAHMRGNLLSKSYYKGNKIYRYEKNDYDIKENNNVADLCGDFFRILYVDDLLESNNLGERVSSDYSTCFYKIIPYNKHLKQTQYYEFLEGVEALDDKILYDYCDSVFYTYFNDENYNSSMMSNCIRSKSAKNSFGKLETTYYSYLYVNNYGYVSLPQTEITVCDGKIISGKRMEYDQNNRLKATYRMPSGISVENRFNLGVSYGASQALLDVIDIPEHSFRYDANGNIIEISFEGIPMASYLWSYQGNHPVAEIKGIGYDEMVAMLPSTLNPTTLSNRSDVIESELNALRNIFPNNDVITITHHWFVGVTSLTDSRGIVTRYNYDEFGRLDQVKDYNNYFIKKYIYNYAQ